MIRPTFSYKLTNIALNVVKVGVLTKISVYLLANVAISQTLFAYSKYHMTHNFNSTAKLLLRK